MPVDDDDSSDTPDGLVAQPPKDKWWKRLVRWITKFLRISP